jgi:tRNA-Thr(GGU) m(6)t(6)A37 methyltransferase TsaA
MEFVMKPIGILHSPFTDGKQTPIQSTRSQAAGWAEVYPEFTQGLQDIEGFSHIILLYIFHQSEGYSLMVKPFLDDKQHGLFTTRYPRRPNPIGISIVRLLKHRGNLLDLGEVDMLDGTPLLDIKPYVPDFDVRKQVKTGWYAHRSKE